MINTLLGIKKQMTSTYDARGRRVGATVVSIEPNFVTQIKSLETKDGYEAVQLGMGNKKSTRKPQIGHVKKAGIDQKIRFFKEVRIGKSENRNVGESDNHSKSSLEGLEAGQEIKINQVFAVGDSLKVTGVSKGRGFQGGVKRYNFAGGPKTHGQSDRHRAPGSIGSGTTPGRVYKGKHMAGHMGVEQVSVLGLEVVGIDRVNNFLLVKGGLPGAFGSMLVLEKQGRIKGYTPPPEEKEDEEEEEAQGGSVRRSTGSSQGEGESEETAKDESESQGVTESESISAKAKFEETEVKEEGENNG
jgi:large subunit ribosomal protein L3